MFVAMNRFKVNEGKEADFEEQWRRRQSYLDQVPGFVRFALLRGPTGDDKTTDFISHSTWESRKAFEDWTNSENFRLGHAQGSVAGVLAGHPVVSLYDAVLTQDAKAAVA
jgi:heme-degrading monooxygenase HmoA